MVSPLREPSQIAVEPNAYPQLDSETLAALNEKLIEIVKILHQRGLSDEQLRELRACIGVQTQNVERLHTFVLRNADEPAFAVQMYSGPRS